MADQDTSLPIRTQADGTDERLHSKIVDYTDPGGVDKQVEVSEKLAHVRVFGNDPAAVKVQLKLSEQGAPNTQGDYDAATNTKPSSNALIAHDRTASPNETHQNKRITGVTNSTVHALDVAIRDESGVPYSNTNPMPVTMAASEGDEVIVPNTTVGLAGAATVDYDYTVTALKTLQVRRISVAASGKVKAEFKVETGVATGLYTRIETQFNSTAVTNVEFVYAEVPKEVAAGVKVRISLTNRDNQPQDVYATLKGIEI